MLVDMLFNAALLGAEWVLYLLLGLSIISMAIAVERALVYARHAADFGGLERDLRAHFSKQNREAALSRLSCAQSPEARICFAGLQHLDSGVAVVKEHVAAATNTERARLEKNLAFLGTVGSNAPFVGLFGTVIGIIRAFNDLSLGSQHGAAAVMSGISEALVATAVGLVVAIPAIAAFNLFKRKAAACLSRADTLTHLMYASLR